MTSSKSFARCSGVRRETWKDSSLSNSGISVDSSGITPEFLIQSMKPSISLARSSDVCPRFLGSSLSNLRKFPLGSYLSFFPFPLFRAQFITSCSSFRRSSGLRLQIGTAPSLLKSTTGSVASSAEASSWLRSQSRAPSISSALSSGVSPFFFGSMLSNLRYSPVGSYLSSFFWPFPFPLRIHCKIFSRSFDRCFGVRSDVTTAFTFFDLVFLDFLAGSTS
mmetsp:Transcript_13677/g.33072  ORF Transcript_13677/g.33072 Transcript_13677/m.33072 type:complete len:221 (+) Transcript_13677:2526-3188(+)